MNCCIYKKLGKKTQELGPLGERVLGRNYSQANGYWGETTPINCKRISPRFQAYWYLLKYGALNKLCFDLTNLLIKIHSANSLLFKALEIIKETIEISLYRIKRCLFF